jgi:Skp family chaperone for outer membrane proteins
MGFTLIFNKFQGALVYADDSVDITDQVIERFDASSSSN